MTTFVQPAPTVATSAPFGVSSHPLAVPLSQQSASSTATLSPSLVHRPIPIAAASRASPLGAASPILSIPSTQSAFTTAAANSAFSPTTHPRQLDSAAKLSSSLPSSSSVTFASSDFPPGYARPSSTASTDNTASPSMSHKSLASAASPLSATRHQRQSSLSSTQSSPSNHRGSLSSDGGSSNDLLGMSRMDSGKEASDAQQDVSPVDEDEEDKPTDDSADDDEVGVPPTAHAPSTSVKDEDAPAPHMTVGLSPAQLAAVHKGTSCHQCKNTKQLKKLAFCANLFNKRTKPEKRVCRKKYCETCLKKFYNDNLSDIVGKSWICASCRGVCCCAACTRVGSKKVGKLEATNVGGGLSSAQSHSPPMSSSNTPIGSAHSTASFDKRSLQAGQMDAMAISALPVTAASVPAMLPSNAAPLNFSAAVNSLARQQQAAMQVEMINNAHLLATLSPAQQQQIQQQQMLLYNQLQQQQLQQQILLNNIQQQQQLVAALQMQQQQHQQHQQLPTANSAQLLPLAPLASPLATAFAQPPMSLPMPLSAPVEQDLSTSMLRHSLHDQPHSLPAHLSPSVSPSTSPLLYTRTTRPASGKSSSPSATKRLYMQARDWPYPSSSPVSSSRAVSDTSSETNSPLNSTRELLSAHSTPQSGFRTPNGGLPAAATVNAEDVRMDESGAAANSAFNAFSSRKDAVFSNLHRLTQGDGK